MTDFAIVDFTIIVRYGRGQKAKQELYDSPSAAKGRLNELWLQGHREARAMLAPKVVEQAEASS